MVSRAILPTSVNLRPKSPKNDGSGRDVKKLVQPIFDIYVRGRSEVRNSLFCQLKSTKRYSGLSGVQLYTGME
jgi:hypothetical protein